jgi:hypothetical protein
MGGAAALQAAVAGHRLRSRLRLPTAASLLAALLAKIFRFLVSYIEDVHPFSGVRELDRDSGSFAVRDFFAGQVTDVNRLLRQFGSSWFIEEPTLSPASPN